MSELEIQYTELANTVIILYSRANCQMSEPQKQAASTGCWFVTSHAHLHNPGLFPVTCQAPSHSVSGIGDAVLYGLKSWQQSGWRWKLRMHHNYPVSAIWEALHSKWVHIFIHVLFLGEQSKGSCQQDCWGKGAVSYCLKVIHLLYSDWQSKKHLSKYNFTSKCFVPSVVKRLSAIIWTCALESLRTTRPLFCILLTWVPTLYGVFPGMFRSSSSIEWNDTMNMHQWMEWNMNKHLKASGHL